MLLFFSCASVSRSIPPAIDISVKSLTWNDSDGLTISVEVSATEGIFLLTYSQTQINNMYPDQSGVATPVFFGILQSNYRNAYTLYITNSLSGIMKELNLVYLTEQSDTALPDPDVYVPFSGTKEMKIDVDSFEIPGSAKPGYEIPDTVIVDEIYCEYWYSTASPSGIRENGAEAKVSNEVKVVGRSHYLSKYSDLSDVISIDKGLIRMSSMWPLRDVADDLLS